MLHAIATGPRPASWNRNLLTAWWTAHLQPVNACGKATLLAVLYPWRPLIRQAAMVCCSHTLLRTLCLQPVSVSSSTTPVRSARQSCSLALLIACANLKLLSCRLHLHPRQVIRENQVVVVVGETGSGKTTQMTQVGAAVPCQQHMPTALVALLPCTAWGTAWLMPGPALQCLIV